MKALFQKIKIRAIDYQIITKLPIQKNRFYPNFNKTRGVGAAMWVKDLNNRNKYANFVKTIIG